MAGEEQTTLLLRSVIKRKVEQTSCEQLAGKEIKSLLEVQLHPV